MNLVANWYVEDCGVNSSQYFSGRGISGTSWKDCFVGIGGSAYEALEDALDIAYQCDWDTKNIPNEMNRELTAGDCVNDIESDVFHFVALYVK